ncbi:MAG TPA: DegT/DnrJ/EryC1/StrS family aminotransferase [Verrucomicrobiaceae bacterium]|jgi:dTDP-4-amino-4,6-dideoxygalactose transaminase
MEPPPLFSAYPLEDYRAHRATIDEALRRMLEAGHYILGSEVENFEKEFAAFVGVKHGIGVANGTDAIELLLRGLDIGRGAAVAVPSHTAVASVSAIARAGARPVFVDVDPRTFTMNAAGLAAALDSTHGTEIKAVLAVHLYGHPADLSSIGDLCAKRGLALLEDCAQSHGAVHHGRNAGSVGRGSSFSFYPTKNLGAIGDGGAVCTNDDELAQKIRWIRQYGWRERYISALEGVNSRLDEMQAAILRVKLPHLAASNEKRRALAARYAAGLKGLPVQIPVEAESCRHVYHLYVVRAERRDALLQHLTQRGVPAALHYPAAVHQQPAYFQVAKESPALPHTDALIKDILSLPLHPHLSTDAVDAACAALREFYQRR